MKNTFEKIDLKIEAFRKGKRIGFTNRIKSDWLKFEYWKLYWNENEINHQIEIFPTFNAKEEIEEWNFTCLATFDSEGFRYFEKKNMLNNKNIDVIENQLERLLAEGYDFLNVLEKREMKNRIKLSK